jgi:hypothetical protein
MFLWLDNFTVWFDKENDFAANRHASAEFDERSLHRVTTAKAPRGETLWGALEGEPDDSQSLCRTDARPGKGVM